MKVSFSWLKEHVELALSAKDLAEHLLRLGFEVVSIEKRGPAFSGVVTAQIREIAKHPNADRLSLCVVDDGSTRHSVVCGAKNIEVGQKVPLARVGALLPGDFKIAKSKIRGVESSGMICSAQELGMGAANGGILVLDAATPLGQDFAARLGEADEILDVEITPNRPDCLSHLGLARELAAYFRLPLTPPASKTTSFMTGSSSVAVSVEDKAACPLYTARVLEDVEIGPSPAWLASRLEAVGMRPINAMVDITNYLLLDMGQPMHAFDLDKLEGGRICVRFAKAGESLKALDGKEYALTPEILVIADAKKPVAIAGVMGGLSTGVTEKTTRVLLESAYFNPVVVRKASQSLRLRSDSSYRFERGVDPAAAPLASARAAELAAKLCKGVKVSPAAQASAALPARLPVSITTERANKILGAEFPQEQVEGALKAVAGEFQKKGDLMIVVPPSYRGDLETPWDLAEEVARLLSYDSIPAKTAPVAPRPARLTRLQEVASRAKQRLAALGLCEAYNYDFLSEKRLSAARLQDADKWARLANPLSEDWTVLRPSLLPGLLENARTNLNRGAPSVRLFEVGTVYEGGKAWPDERVHLAGIMLGPVTEAFWQAARVPRAGFYDALGVIQELLGSNFSQIRSALAAAPPSPEDAVFSRAATQVISGQRGRLATIGALHPQAARAFDLEREEAVIFSIDLQGLAEIDPTPFKLAPINQFPSSKRDLSFFVDASRSYASLVEMAVLKNRPVELVNYELIDVFSGKGVPDGKRSLTMRFHFSRADRTITDAEVNAVMERIVAILKSGAGAEPRG